MESTFPPIEKFMNGRFYQVKAKDAERIAKRIFQIYDKDASNIISTRECKQILKNIYAGIEPGKVFSESEIKEFIKVLDFDGDGVLKEDDFKNTVKKYFVNENKTGSLDMQNRNQDMFALVNKNQHGVDEHQLYEDLYKMGIERFSKGFIDNQMILANELFEEVDVDNNEKLSYEEFSKVFKKIYKEIGMVTKKSAPLKEEDIRRLVEMIDYDDDNMISKLEFRIYYLKGILGR